MTDSIDTAKDSAAPDDKAGEVPESGPEDELAKARAEAEENWNKYLRLAAEMENLRKRSSRDLENARKYGIERFAEELLAVVDSLEMGLEMGLEAGENASVESLLEGKQATLKLLHLALEKSGVTGIDPEGEPFDPELHEAMTLQPSDVTEPGSVVTVVQKGYALNGRLLRPARVIVASEPDESAESGGANGGEA
jgi:molecular chaperone GrpE